jgi:hypothetical protein
MFAGNGRILRIEYLPLEREVAMKSNKKPSCSSHRQQIEKLEITLKVALVLLKALELLILLRSH